MWRDDRAVATTEGDIAEVLEAETLVDMQKLRELSTHGIPNNLRAEAWKYLLGVARPEKDEEMSLHRQNIEEYRELEEAWQVDAQSELTRKIKAELKRHRPELPFFRDARTRQRLERLLRAFLHGSAAVEFRPGLVHLLGPLVHVYAKNEEVEAFFCFQELMGRLLREKLLTFEGCKRTSVTFMTLFRHTLPDLYFFFEEAQCAGGLWLSSWLQFLLARELPLPCVLRLWDTYFALEQKKGGARADLQELHVYVCLAILEACAEEIMELDETEVLWYLNHLPDLDMGSVVMQAFNLKDDLQQKLL